MIPDGTHVVSEVDRERDFVISYFLVDDSMSIYEAPKRNLGLTGGRFLARGPAPKKPGTNKPYQVRTASIFQTSNRKTESSIAYQGTDSKVVKGLNGILQSAALRCT